MPQLQYLNPDDDNDWDSSPSPEPSQSPPAEEHLTGRTPSPSAEKIASRGPDATMTAPNSTLRSSVADIARNLSGSANSPVAGFGQAYEHNWNASGPSISSIQRLPSPAPYEHVPSRSPGPPAAKRVKTEVIDLESTPEISQTVRDEDSRSPSPSPSSKLLNSFMNKVPRVRKDEWSDDSSDELQMKRKEEDFESYHRPRRGDSEDATPDFIEHVETDQVPPPVGRPGSSDTVNVRRKSKTELNASADGAGPKKRHSYYSTVRYRFPKVPRRDLEHYIFLAACVKHAGERFKPDFEAVGKECGISTSTVGNKLRKLKKKLDEEGPAFGHPDAQYDPGG